MNRAEHLRWAKDRANEYAGMSDGASAIASLRSDLGKHPDTTSLCGVVDDLMFPLMLNGHLSDPAELHKFIEGFN